MITYAPQVVSLAATVSTDFLDLFHHPEHFSGNTGINNEPLAKEAFCNVATFPASAVFNFYFILQKETKPRHSTNSQTRQTKAS